MLHIVIPTYESETRLPGLLSQLRGRSVIIADGGSPDSTLREALRGGARLAIGATGRGAQLRLGGRFACLRSAAEDWLLFLHDDCRMPDGWAAVVEAAMAEGDPRYFRFGADASGLGARMMERWVGVRCALLGLPYGDQGLLVSRVHYEAAGGYAPLPLFEDVDLVERLERIARLRPLPARLMTDVSAHKQNGYWRRGLRNLSLLWRYKGGADPQALLDAYR